MARSSVIIPVRNDAERLTKLLASFEPRDWEQHEVLVVDDGSTDDTVAAAARFPARVVRLERTVGPAAARNHGARVARWPILVFVDSDVVLGPGALTRLIGWFDDSLASGVSTIASATPENPGFVARYCAVTDKHVCEHWDAPAGGAAGDRCTWFSTRLGAIRADIFAEVGGFDARFERPSIEDAEFSVRLARSHTLVLDRGVAHTHHWPASPTVLLRRVFTNAKLLMREMRDDGEVGRDVMPVTERAGRVLGGLGVLLLPATPLSAAAAIAAVGCLLASAWCHRALFGAYYRAGGLRFTLGCSVLHYLTTCAGLVGACVGAVTPVAKTKLGQGQA
ncbi:MAG TPA: glycosyltransferase [Candidatus Polarisedimenticolaceae bacterium]|nr:glycosyltransferase [Candidatus Polarisedimenticolaceae bacterium]